jgi:hypothetical protein
VNKRFDRVKLICVTLCVASIAFAQSPTFKPSEGFVPDNTTAIAIAEAVLKPVYGEQQIRSEEPFSATLENDVWTIDGHLPPSIMDGGVATVRLSRTDGRILYMMHGK